MPGKGMGLPGKASKGLSGKRGGVVKEGKGIVPGLKDGKFDAEKVVPADSRRLRTSLAVPETADGACPIAPTATGE